MNEIKSQKYNQTLMLYVFKMCMLWVLTSSQLSTDETEKLVNKIF